MSDYSTLSTASLSEWKVEIENDLPTQLGAAALQIYNADETLINRKALLKNSTKVFNNKIEIEGAPVTNQKSSGRCWLFAATNVLRVKIMKKLNLKEFQFSQSFLFFYDKLEKSNFFLEQIIASPDDEVDSRFIQHLLTDPVGDGGQYDMFINIVEKYGLVPQETFPDVYTSTASRTLNFLVTTKLREFAEVLRNELKAGNSVEALKLSMQKEIHRLLVIFLGPPPSPEQQLSWEYTDKDDKYGKLEFTPLSLYKEVLGEDLSKCVSLLNDPRNTYNKNIKIDKLGNVVGGKTVKYLNVDIDDLSDYAVKRIQSGEAVFFGTHTPIYMDKKRGIMDESLYDYKLINYEAKQEKASRVEYHQSLMTHAMTLTAVHLDEENKPVRWRVENSWGKDSGNDGYYVMDHQYFKDYVYQIVVKDTELSEEHQAIFKDDSQSVTLPPWDPMGALAVFSNATQIEY